MSNIIFLDSKCFPIKSIYRIHSGNGKIKTIYIRLDGDDPACQYKFENEKWIEYIINLNLKRGDLVTVHTGNGYLSIEKGDKVPKNGNILYITQNK